MSPELAKDVLAHARSIFYTYVGLCATLISFTFYSDSSQSYDDALLLLRHFIALETLDSEGWAREHQRIYCSPKDAPAACKGVAALEGVQPPEPEDGETPALSPEELAKERGWGTAKLELIAPSLNDEEAPSGLCHTTLDEVARMLDYDRWAPSSGAERTTPPTTNEWLEASGHDPIHVVYAVSPTPEDRRSLHEALAPSIPPCPLDAAASGAGDEETASSRGEPESECDRRTLTIRVSGPCSVTLGDPPPSGTTPTPKGDDLGNLYGSFAVSISFTEAPEESSSGSEAIGTTHPTEPTPLEETEVSIQLVYAGSYSLKDWIYARSKPGHPRDDLAELIYPDEERPPKDGLQPQRIQQLVEALESLPDEGILDQPPRRAQSRIKRERTGNATTIELFGLTVPLRTIRVTSGIIIALLSAFIATHMVHLRRLFAREPTVRETFENYPWISLFKGSWFGAANFGLLVVVPVAASVLGLVLRLLFGDTPRQAWDPGWDWVTIAATLVTTALGFTSHLSLSKLRTGLLQLERDRNAAEDAKDGAAPSTADAEHELTE